MQITEQEILNALRQIIDPDFRKDIVSLGFVQNIQINKAHVSFDIALTTIACPIKDDFKRQAITLVSQLPGVESVAVQMTVLSKAKPQTNISSEALKKVSSIIAISSCKGGVGKSTLAAHLAQELAGRGYKVGLVDTDIYGPSIPSLFGAQNHRVQMDQNKFFIPLIKNNLKIMSFGFLLGDAPAVMRGPIVTRYVQQMLLNTNWGELDYLFIDMPPGTGDVQLTITQTLRLSGAVIVTTPQTLSLIDVARGILMFERVQVPILGLIENMAFFICDQCDKKHYIFGGREQTESLKNRFGIDLLGEIPLLPQMTLSIEKPVANTYIMQTVDLLIRSLGKNSLMQNEIPKVTLEDRKLILQWQDETIQTAPFRDLRLSCRCALCVNELTGEKTLDEKTIKMDIAPTEVFPLGNYALAISWNDGHSSGIYTYEMIKELSKQVLNKV
jgi:Mrp family chromosome partitioning ATPase/DUF971 family protein